MCLYHSSAQICLNMKRLRYTVLEKQFRFVGVLNRLYNKRDCAIFNGGFCVVASVKIDGVVSPKNVLLQRSNILNCLPWLLGKNYAVKNVGLRFNFFRCPCLDSIFKSIFLGAPL